MVGTFCEEGILTFLVIKLSELLHEVTMLTELACLLMLLLSLFIPVCTLP